MIPLTFGAQVVRLYGAVALKLKALFTAVTVLLCLTEVKVPTAYIVPPHCTSWRTCSTAPVVFSCGVLAGDADTGPAGPAALAGARPARSSPALTAEASSAPGTSRRMMFLWARSGEFSHPRSVCGDTYVIDAYISATVYVVAGREPVVPAAARPGRPAGHGPIT